MSFRIGPFDPLQLTLNVMNVLMRKNALTYEEAREIIRNSLPLEMPQEEKEQLLNSIVTKNG